MTSPLSLMASHTRAVSVTADDSAQQHQHLASDVFTSLIARAAVAAQTAPRSSRAGSDADRAQHVPQNDEDASDAVHAGKNFQASSMSTDEGAHVLMEQAIRRLIATDRCQDAAGLLQRAAGTLDACTADVLRGEIFVAKGRLSEASSCFLAILTDHPAHEGALHAIAEVHRQNEDLDSCVAVRAVHTVVEPAYASACACVWCICLDI